MREIERITGINHQKISIMLDEHNIPKRLKSHYMDECSKMLDKDTLYTKYVIEQKTFRQISRETGVNRKFIPRLMKKYNIDRKESYGKLFQRKCMNCGKDFEITEAQYLNDKKKFCSKQCKVVFVKSQIIYEEAVCVCCGKTFTYKKSKKNKNARIFCSHACQTKRCSSSYSCEYSGIIFRSSWEVDFAKFLDSYRLTWQYEPKTFRLSKKISYRPDFYIKEYDCWVEIKGYEKEIDKEKNRLFKEKISKKIYIIRGNTYFHYLWWVQEVFNSNFFDRDNLSEETKQQLTSQYCLHLIAEANEVLNTVNWKMHQDKKSNKVFQSQVVSECVDVFKYLLGLCQIWGFDSQLVLNEAIKKSKVVELKYAAGHELKSLKNKQVIACDIDGVLNNYPLNFIQFVNQKLNTSYSNYRDMKSGVEAKTLIDLKDDFRETGLESQGEVNEDSRNFLKTIDRLGKYIILLSSRPVEKHPSLYYNTYDWLRLNNFNFNALYFSKYKHLEIIKKVPNIEFMIEDNRTFANQIAERGFIVFLLSNEYNRGDIHENVIRVDSLNQIINFINT